MLRLLAEWRCRCHYPRLQGILERSKRRQCGAKPAFKPVRVNRRVRRKLIRASMARWAG
jgi:hypothetical protein